MADFTGVWTGEGEVISVEHADGTVIAVWSTVLFGDLRGVGARTNRNQAVLAVERAGEPWGQILLRQSSSGTGPLQVYGFPDDRDTYRQVLEPLVIAPNGQRQ